MPPFVPSLSPRNGVPSPLEDKDVFNQGAFLERSINNGLGSDGLSTTTTFIGSNDNAGLAILDTITKRLRRETGEDDRVDSTNTRTSEEGGDGVPGHGEIDRDGVPLFDTKAFENIGDAGDLAEELCIGDLSTLTRLVGLVDDSGLIYRVRFIVQPRHKPTHLVGVLERPTINTVVGGVEAALGEPSDITGGESTRPDSLERAIPVQGLACHL